MKRRNFLLSIPLIGAAVKAVAKEPDDQPPVWVKEHAQVITKSINKKHLQYPLTERECHYPIGRVKFVKRVGYKKYEVHVDMVGSESLSLIRNGVHFQRAGGGFVLEHKIMNTTASTRHNLTVTMFKKKSQISIGDKMIISFQAANV